MTAPGSKLVLSKSRTFGVLWGLGFAGVLSLLLVPLPEAPFSTAVFKLLTLLQPLVLMTAMTWVGAMLASQVGLDVPLLRSLHEGGRVSKIARSQITAASLVALILFVVMLGIQSWAEPHLPAIYLALNQDATELLPPATRLLYGGITEEILMRWGLMTLLVWVPWKLLQKSAGRPHAGIVWGAIAVTALLFGLGHLPLLFSLVPQSPEFLAPQVTRFLAAYIVGLNALMGIGTGWLYWRHGLEAAMMAHVLFHLLGLVIQ